MIIKSLIIRESPHLWVVYMLNSPVFDLDVLYKIWFQISYLLQYQVYPAWYQLQTLNGNYHFNHEKLNELVDENKTQKKRYSNSLKSRATFTLNNAITTEKKLMNAVAKIRGFEMIAGLLNTWVWEHHTKYYSILNWSDHVTEASTVKK